MTNAAHELADLLEKWMLVPAGKNVYVTRGGTSENAEFWRHQIHAVALLDEVSRSLLALQAAGKRVSHYERAFPAWARGTFSAHENWNATSQSPQRPIGQPSIDLLVGLGDYLGATASDIPLTAADRITMRSAVESVLEELTSDEVQLSETERRYVFELAHSILALLEKKASNTPVDLLQQVHELFGFLTLLTERLPEQGGDESPASRLRRAARRIVPYALGGSAFVAGAIGVAADVQQIAAVP